MRSPPVGIFCDYKHGLMIRFEDRRERKATDAERATMLAALRAAPQPLGVAPMTAPMTAREALQDALDEWARANLPTESAGCITSWSDWIAAFVCDGVFGDSQMHPLSDIRDLDEVVRELGIQDSSTTPAEAVRELNAEIERLRSIAKEDWQEDPSADERWNAGCTFAMLQLCHALGVDPQSISWDAATETLDGDVCAVIWNILRAKMGENWDPHAIPDPAKTPASADAAHWKERHDIVLQKHIECCGQQPSGSAGAMREALIDGLMLDVSAVFPHPEDQRAVTSLRNCFADRLAATPQAQENELVPDPRPDSLAHCLRKGLPGNAERMRLRFGCCPCGGVARNHRTCRHEGIGSDFATGKDPMTINRNRPAKNPGGMQCERCDEIFIGEEWHAFCAICVKKTADEIAEAQGLRSPQETIYAK